MSARRGHALEDVPAPPASGVQPVGIPYTRAKTLDGNPLRLAARVRVLGWFREALREHPRGAAGVAADLHISPTLLGYWTSGERDLSVADLVACPKPVAKQVLRQALDSLEDGEVGPASPGGLVGEAMAAVHFASTVAVQLERSKAVPFESMSADMLRDLLDLVRKSMAKLEAIERRLVQELEKALKREKGS
jgi:hypothetical protein